MAYPINVPGFSISLIAAADLSAKQYYAIKVDTDGKAALAGAGLGIGILQDEPVSGAIGQVAVSGISPAIAGGTVTAGDRVTANASGKLVTATAGKTDTSDVGAAADPLIGSNVIGIALTSAAADEQFSLLILQQGAVPSTAA